MTTTSHHRQENTSYIFEMAVTLGLHNRDTVIEISCECNPKMFAEHERTPKQNYIIKPNVIHYWDIDHIMPIKVAEFNDATFSFILANCLLSIQNGFAHLESLFAHDRLRALETAPTTHIGND